MPGSSDQLDGFLVRTPLRFQSVVPSPNFVPVGHTNKMLNWLLRPVARDKCKLHELHDGTYDLCDIALMNEMIDIDLENSYRAHRAAEAK